MSSILNKSVLDSKDYNNPNSILYRGILKNNVLSSTNVNNKPKNEQLKLKEGGIEIDGIKMTALFEVSGVEASGLQIIQIAFSDARDFVDGGINSPTMKEYGEPVYKDKPYYLSELNIENEKEEGLYKWDGYNGTIWTMDEPAAIFTNISVIFETAVIAVNYKGSGKDKILGAFRWGWDDYEPVHTGNGINLQPSFSLNALKVVKKDYPNYHFYEE